MKWRLYKEKLLWLRLNHGWSQEEAAFRCEASDKKQYHLWETGKTQRPQRRTLQAIANAFQLDSIDELILQPSNFPDPSLDIFYNSHFRLAPGATNTSDIVANDAQREEDKPFRLICFDLDATLIHGYKFSWQVVWDMLGDPEQLRKQGLRMFHSGVFSYEEWCLWCCQQFGERQLKQADIQQKIREFSLAPNLIKGLKQLKQAGYKLAIISGGLEEFLQILLPDYKQYFDYCFINKMQFDDKGDIKSIVSTPFDYEKKCEGIRYLASVEKISPKQIVFVGSTYVDQYVVDTAGWSIGYYNPEVLIQELFDHVIEGDDFQAVVDLINSRLPDKQHLS
ncbi:MAG: hypothetical protein COA99_10595 [Moraxellaceae bacterium]|nr:MAG: hypothetical protein COA99_10595 [Moraxellaceae bacterium]